ncbi:spore maturation protein CgeD [Neobacillus niacini]|uniref:glycosyltransferase family A protein n=1 Tax=Neobacillus niacini TaxID=86668 RepID=UPI002781E3E3|nr:glycosyltransferase family A protein [Neobacillus niacini]MDQ1003608.1 spore maturation protein CgeD [Neobacillus niacini]
MEQLVSIILTSYNKPKTIAGAIESVIKQTFPHWELFIMDDNSNKETVQIIKRYLHDPRIYYFNSHIKDEERFKTTRYATLINNAIPKSKGEFITYLTDDNVFLQDRIEKMVKIFVQNPNIDIVYSQQLVKWIDETAQVVQQFVRKTRGVLNNPVGVVDHCSIMHTRKILEKIYNLYGSYWDDDPDYWFNGDAAFWKRLTNFSLFFPIPQTLDIALKDPYSFQRLYKFLPENIPNGTLVKGLSSDLYIIDNQERREVMPQVLERLKYDPSLAVTIPDPFLFKYNKGTPVDHTVFQNLIIMPNQRLIKSHHHPSVYYLQNNQKRLINNERTFRQYKFQWNKIVMVDDRLLSEIPDGPAIEEIGVNSALLPDGILFKEKRYYLSQNNHLHLIEENVAEKLNLPIRNPVIIGRSFINRFNQGVPFTWKYIH